MENCVAPGLGKFQSIIRSCIVFDQSNFILAQDGSVELQFCQTRLVFTTQGCRSCAVRVILDMVTQDQLICTLRSVFRRDFYCIALHVSYWRKDVH